MDAFQYGAYKEFYDDPRTQKALKDIDALCKKMNVSYAIIGGIAAFIHVKNPPEDYPDIDVLIYSDASEAIRFIKAISKKPGYHLKFMDVDEAEDGRPEMVFSTVILEKDIQIDIFTSRDENVIRETIRAEGVEIEMVEPLIIEKLIRSTEEDIRIVIDLLAYKDYNKKLLSQIAREYKSTGMLENATYWARRWAAGRLSEAGLNAVVKRIAKS